MCIVEKYEKCQITRKCCNYASSSFFDFSHLQSLNISSFIYQKCEESLIRKQVAQAFHFQIAHFLMRIFLVSDFLIICFKTKNLFLSHFEAWRWTFVEKKHFTMFHYLPCCSEKQLLSSVCCHHLLGFFLQSDFRTTHYFFLFLVNPVCEFQNIVLAMSCFSFSRNWYQLKKSCHFLLFNDRFLRNKFW